MKKINVLWFVGMCTLCVNSAFAMQSDDEKPREDRVIFYGNDDVTLADSDYTTQPEQTSPLYALWEKLPNKQAFRAWYAGLKSKPTFIRAKRTLGIVLFSILLYQSWLYAHTQCDSDGRIAQAMCDASLATESFGLLLKSLLIKFGLGLKTFAEWIGKATANEAARLDDCLKKGITREMKGRCFSLYSDY